MSEAHYTLEELAQASGASRRTIRFWISRDLLPGPNVAGRKASYGARHLERIAEIQRLQRDGFTLAEIAGAGDAPHHRPAVEPIAWWQIPVAEGVQVWVRGDLAPWRQRAVRRAVEEMERRLAMQKEESADGGER